MKTKKSANPPMPPISIGTPYPAPAPTTWAPLHALKPGEAVDVATDPEQVERVRNTIYSALTSYGRRNGRRYTTRITAPGTLTVYCLEPQPGDKKP